MHVDMGALPRIQDRDHERLTVRDNPDVADGARVEDLIDRLTVVAAAAGTTADGGS